MDWIILLFVTGFAVLSSGQVQNQGQRFALTCYPMFQFNTVGQCDITIMTFVSTTVTITTAWQNDTLQLGPGELHRYIVDATHRTTDGVEQKAIYVDSDQDIVLHLANEWESSATDGIDTSLGLPYSADATEFYVPSCATGETDCSTPEIYSFYVVVAFEDNTQVTIMEKDGAGGENVVVETLNTFDVLTRSYADPNLDHTGTHITSTTPVTVISGNACPAFHISGGYRGDLATHVPSISQLERSYIAPPVTGFNYIDEPFYIRVVSTVDDTEITITGANTFPNVARGDYVEVEAQPNTEGKSIQCSAPCLSYTMVPEWNHESAQFMFVHTSNANFYTDVTFATVRDSSPGQFDNQIGIVVQTQGTPELTLDGAPLDISWDTSITGFVTGYTATSEGRHQLTSTNGDLFGAYIYGHCTFFDGTGYGHPAAL